MTFAPFAAADGYNVARLIDELVPCLAAMVGDVVVGFEDAVRQPVVAHELPDVFDGFEFRALGGKRDDADVAGHFELAGGMPSGLIHQHDRVRARRNGERYFGQVQRHGFSVAEGQDETDTFIVLRADRAKDVCRLRPLVLGRRRPGSASRPAPCDLVLLAHAGLVLEPDCYGRALREGGSDFCQFGGVVPFLKASIACSLWVW